MDALFFRILDISIHALTRSATLRQDTRDRHRCISIHALTRSATGRFLQVPGDHLDFNPRTHEECDVKTGEKSYNLQLFQSTHSRGVRRGRNRETRNDDAISIHALTRSATTLKTDIGVPVEISIHALTRSATGSKLFWFDKDNISIHALTRSATYLHGKRSFMTVISIHALTRSATANYSDNQ